MKNKQKISILTFSGEKEDSFVCSWLLGTGLPEVQHSKTAMTTKKHAILDLDGERLLQNKNGENLGKNKITGDC